MNTTYARRYILDSLYGIVHMPEEDWDVLICPEVQRLREVRLCNINSLCLTGAANISRYEHAIGTYFLAGQCLSSWPRRNPFLDFNAREERTLRLAALLHDVITGAFGHSVEYIEVDRGFEHEKGFQDVVLGNKAGLYEYLSVTFDSIFFGMLPKLIEKLSAPQVKEIGSLISGRGRFGPLVNGSMDLDNIDNVVRMSFHLGLTKTPDIAVELARSMWTEGQELVVKKEAVPLVIAWQAMRRRLYTYLLCSPDEFAAKCMLSEAIEEARAGNMGSFKWYNVDYELLTALLAVSEGTAQKVRRLMSGDLYGCLGVYSVRWARGTEETLRRRRSTIASEISTFTEDCVGENSVTLHIIRDINKTDRQVVLRTDDGCTMTLGTPSNRLLIGVFYTNARLNMTGMGRLKDLARAQQEALAVLSRVLDDPGITVVGLFSEVDLDD
jgi:HD superfamily phosphohydrolase